MARLGFGELEPADRRPSRSVGRIAFLEAVRMHAPGVLSQLRGRVLPKLPEGEAVTLGRIWRASPDCRPHLLPLRVELLEWGKKWDLSDSTRRRNPWIWETALLTLDSWRGVSDPPLRWTFPSTGHSYPYSEAEQQLGQHPGPDLTAETAPEAEGRLVREIGRRRMIRTHLGELREKAEERGFVRVPEIRDRDGEGLALRFAWLALYVCGHQTTQQIADWCGYSQAAVWKGIRRTAHLIGLELPPDRGMIRR